MNYLTELEYCLDLYLLLDEPQDKAQDTKYLIDYIKNSLVLKPNNTLPCQFAMCNISQEKKRSALYVLWATHHENSSTYKLIERCPVCPILQQRASYN